MPPIIRSALVGLFVCVATFGVTPAASAAEPVPLAISANTPSGSNAVLGTSWSAPAFPVDCEAVIGQVSCTPDNPADVRAQQCFIGVPFEGRMAMVCTTFDGHHDALRAAGGRAVLVSYGCNVGDLVCSTFENFGRGMALGATASAFAMGISISFDTDSTLWSAAVSEWSFWHWAVLAVVFAAMLWSITAAVVSRDHEQLVAALVRSFIAVPAVPLTLWTIGHLVNALDDMTWYILSGGGTVSLFITLQTVMWAGGQAANFLALLIQDLLLLEMLLLVLVLMFCNL